jgi:hypothetical protein
MGSIRDTRFARRAARESDESDHLKPRVALADSRLRCATERRAGNPGLLISSAPLVSSVCALRAEEDFQC